MRDMEALVSSWREACALKDASLSDLAHQLAALRSQPAASTPADTAALMARLASREREVGELSRMLRAWEAMRAGKDAAIRAALARAEAAESQLAGVRQSVEGMRRAAARGAGAVALPEKENLGKGVAPPGPVTESAAPPERGRALRTLQRFPSNSAP